MSQLPASDPTATPEDQQARIAAIRTRVVQETKWLRSIEHIEGSYATSSAADAIDELLDALASAQADEPEPDLSGFLQSVLVMYGLPGYDASYFDAQGNWQWSGLRAAIDRQRASAQAAAPSPRDVIADLVDACYAEGSSPSWRVCQVCNMEYQPDEAMPSDQTHEKECVVEAAERWLRQHQKTFVLAEVPHV